MCSLCVVGFVSNNINNNNIIHVMRVVNCQIAVWVSHVVCVCNVPDRFNCESTT